MKLDAVLGQHVDDANADRHRLTLLDPRRIRCHDCAVTVVLPEAIVPAPTAVPPPFRRFDDPNLRSMPSWVRERYTAERAARKGTGQ